MQMSSMIVEWSFLFAKIFAAPGPRHTYLCFGVMLALKNYDCDFNERVTLSEGLTGTETTFIEHPLQCRPGTRLFKKTCSHI